MPTIKSRSVCVVNSQKTAGALNISSDGLTITITGSAFETRWGEGDKIVCSGQTNYVRAKQSTTVMLMQTAFPAGMRSTNGNSYTLNRAYSGANAISAAYAACPSDLQADDSIWDIVLYKDGGAFNEKVDFNRAITTGYGTNTGYYIKLRAAIQDRHTGVRNSGVIIKYAPVSLGGACHNIGNACRVEWIEWDGSSVSSVWSESYNGTAIYLNCGGAGADYGPGYFRNNLVYDWSRTSTTGPDYGVIVLSLSCIYRGMYAYNNRFFGNGKSNYGTKAIYISTYGNPEVYNNSILHKSGLSGSYHFGIVYDTALSQTYIAKNNIVCGFTICYNFYTGSTEDYNLASDTSLSGAHDLISKTASNQFMNTTNGTEELNLKIGADAISAGTNLSASCENISIDALGNTRSVVWDMGSSQKTYITKTHIQDGEYNTGGSYVVSTSAFTPAANKLYIISVWTTSSYGTVSDPTVSASNGLTPVLIHKAGGVNTYDLKLWTYRAMKSSGLSNGLIQFTWSGVPVDRTRWSIEEFDGVDTGGTDGANGVVQYISASETVGPGYEDVIVPLSAFSHTDDFAYMTHGAYGYEQVSAFSTSFANMANRITETSANSFTAWVRDGNPIVPSGSAIIIKQNSFQIAVVLSIGMEIRANSNALPPTPPVSGNWFLLQMRNELAYGANRS